MSREHEKYMAMAIEESRKGLQSGEMPFGSVIVHDGEIIGRAYATLAADNDPTAHAEIKAVRDASARLKTTDLSWSTLYTSCEPCPMCCGAIINARIGTLVISGRSETLFALRGLKTEREYKPDRLARMTNSDLEVIWGVLQDESEDVMREYKGWAD